MATERYLRVAEFAELSQLRLHLLAHVGCDERPGEFGVETIERFARRGGRREQTKPGADVETGQPGLGDGGKLGREAAAPGRRHRERLHLAGAHLAERRGEVVEHQLDLAADEVLHRGCGALVAERLCGRCRHQIRESL